MVANPEQQARQAIDQLLSAAGWAVQDVASTNLNASLGVAIREFPLASGYGFADYLLYVDGKACGVIEAKKQSATLAGVEAQSARYVRGLPAVMPVFWRLRPSLRRPREHQTRNLSRAKFRPLERGLAGMVQGAACARI